ncbi:MAG TPA: UDP-2,4-diacetamido-2,4,6-trideoxy-beta-L-altropyranose hydrolase [Gallionella sp.]|nr:UDP-2,4-diacetamido-2,4,6-trideoxy-beta-L-altropyranose hydrolase [Gallionella sp.]
MTARYIAFRVDATSQIGTGHFMRCLTLADALKQRGAQIRFVSRDLPAHLSDMLSEKGIELMALTGNRTAFQADDLAHSHWLGASQAGDAQETILALSGHEWDWLVVDHYALDIRWESSLRSVVRQIMVIDDLADRKHDCDVLLDQNWYADMEVRYSTNVPAHCQLLLGPRYALLRGEFYELRKHMRPRNGHVNRILVFFGGVDIENYTGLAIRALNRLCVNELQVDVVVGAQHPCREEIEAACAAQGYIFHVQTRRMGELMAAADLSIGAGGTAMWERCCLGLPALGICIADNQQKQIADAAEKGLLYAPSSELDVVDLIYRHTEALLENPPLLKFISRTAKELVDGRGAVRVGVMLGVTGIEIRTASANDLNKLFAWRNHPAIRAASRNNSLIDWDDHSSWFASVMADKDRVLLIGYIGDEPMGVVRFDKEGDAAEISIYLVPEAGFAGNGRGLLLSAERWLKVNCLEIKKIRASVLGENAASQQLFLGANYRIENIHYLKEL